jgi:hypothetical protein
VDRSKVERFIRRRAEYLGYPLPPVIKWLPGPQAAFDRLSSRHGLINLLQMENAAFPGCHRRSAVQGGGPAVPGSFRNLGANSSSVGDHRGTSTACSPRGKRLKRWCACLGPQRSPAQGPKDSAKPSAGHHRQGRCITRANIRASRQSLNAPLSHSVNSCGFRQPITVCRSACRLGRRPERASPGRGGRRSSFRSISTAAG